MSLLKSFVLVFLGFSSGAIISAGVFAFILAIGVLSRLAQKSHTEEHFLVYESVILGGGLFGALCTFFGIRLLLGSVITAVLSFFCGVFYGCVVVSLAETLDIIPVVTRRLHIQQGLFFFIIALALGKLAGSLIYFLVPGFIIK